MSSRIAVLVLATALAAVPVAAQDSPSILSLMQSLKMPRAAQEARVLGVPERDIRGMFDLARDRRLSTGDLVGVFEAQNASIREHGPVDNFGAFVQARLGEGLRGRELAAAIRAEHAAHGKGKGYGMAKSGGHDGKGGPGVYGGAGGKPGNADKLDPKGGKPAGAGKSGEHGKNPDPSKKGGETKDKKGGTE